jgi:hypothetical protein
MKKLVCENLNESLKDELINTIIHIIYKNDNEQRKYLESFSEEDLDKMLGDYYLLKTNES